MKPVNALVLCTNFLAPIFSYITKFKVGQFNSRQKRILFTIMDKPENISWWRFNRIVHSKRKTKHENSRNASFSKHFTHLMCIKLNCFVALNVRSWSSKNVQSLASWFVIPQLEFRVSLPYKSIVKTFTMIGYALKKYTANLMEMLV